MAAQQSLKNRGMLAGVTDCGRSQKWGCRGRLGLGFKPRRHSHLASLFGTIRLFGCSLLPLLPRGLGSRRDFAGGKGVKGLLLMGHEKVPHGFGLNGDCGGDTADGAGSLHHRLLLLS